MSASVEIPIDSSARNLLIEFLRHLSHELRSPLSTMSNDLSYLSSCSGAKKLTSWQDALKMIICHLDAVTSYPPAGSNETSFPASLLVERLSGLVTTASLPALTGLQIVGDVDLIVSTLGDICALHQGIDKPELNISAEQEQLILTLKVVGGSRPADQNFFVTPIFSLNHEESPLKLCLAELLLRLSQVKFTLKNTDLLLAVSLWKIPAY